MAGTFIGKDDDPAEKLGRIGPGLARAIALHEEARKKLRLLWKIYLIDCEARGIEPVASPWMEENERGGRNEGSTGRPAAAGPESDHPLLRRSTDA